MSAQTGKMGTKEAKGLRGRLRIRGSRGRGRGGKFHGQPARAVGYKGGDGSGENVQRASCTAPKPPDGTLVGCCRDMCPSRERFQREQGGELNEFEVAAVEKATVRGVPKVIRKTNVHLAVKKFRRSAAGSAGLQADNVRDVHTLQRTMAHLLNNVLVKEIELLKGCPDLAHSQDRFWSVYSFLGDRFRAIRQDFTVQHSVCKEYVNVLEVQICVHVFAFHFFNSGSRKVVGFDSKLCLEQVMQCFTPLLEMYAALPRTPRMFEFVGCYLLLRVDLPTFGFDVYTIFTRFGTDRVLEQALALCKLWHSCSYPLFFSLGRKVSPVLALFVGCMLPGMHANALERMNVTYTPREPMSIEKLAAFLHCQEEEAYDVARSCNLEVVDNCVLFKSRKFDRDGFQVWKRMHFTLVGVLDELKQYI
mmetsp:Transcript_5573/g.8661  ORF Transcript_5573/g.8661 Transcript_5573/m.8661 type:complete len:419 (+) Transcript_5573:134-1390(+)|eukprot:CAMPEP_0203769072 /NCGR_PEP_ID=MMETSP0099_2-20121227/1969_1 /ASSEMBLY_ACC=CAM_ASM_000209 /TAXON_ID=96639 /ORGANISM=" , Strain NY0313808BC1" /LENGTH=418 /DNA_ID=CAMNT_0050665891 /DNA_START=417 /DNA_END=1673 /DNA_ORIENTATION=+